MMQDGQELDTCYQHLETQARGPGIIGSEILGGQAMVLGDIRTRPSGDQ